MHIARRAELLPNGAGVHGDAVLVAQPSDRAHKLIVPKQLGEGLRSKDSAGSEGLGVAQEGLADFAAVEVGVYKRG